MNINKKKTLPLTDKKRESIILEVAQGLQKLFPDSMEFGFTCGGIAGGYATSTHDIDIFCCLNKKITKEKAMEYMTWYKDLHTKHGLPADLDYPGELVLIDDLMKKLELIDNWSWEETVED